MAETPPTVGVMETRYRLKAPIKAILDKHGEAVSVTVPPGALLVRLSQPQ